MVLCQYTKCLPHCSAFEDEYKPPQDCMVWYVLHGFVPIHQVPATLLRI